MRAICLHDKDRIAAFLRRNPALNVYLIGDLDDFFWPYTQWYGLEEAGELREVALLYAGTSLPVLLAHTDDPPAMGALVRGIAHLLPRRMYSHLSAGVLEALADSYTAESHGTLYKMALAGMERLMAVDVSAAVRLGPADLEEVAEFYRLAYPDGWFDPRMLETRQYFGVRRLGQLASVAGIHVYSPAYGVAALGNIATRPDMRGQGLATVATAAACRSVLQEVGFVGLNVRVDNAAAIACYRRLGFEPRATYDEYMLELRAS
ncbi:MAG TPA: GNAT family N-acetyltransferase [Roseiflexaceae bacterium]|nr:GNAT family N-acetyltransferase [Roseiflexaceae bacterium]